MKTKSDLFLEIVALLVQLSQLRPPPRAASDLKAAFVKGPPPMAGHIHLTWTDATLREDGTPVNLGGANVFDQANPTVPLVAVNVGDQMADLTGFAPGDHAFFITFVDTDGVQSGPSNIATVTVPVATASPPKAATDLAASFVP